jgi:NAD(P)-dependent dehydrogenase (short-subunit alcohol dehydrogenase family)
LTFKLLESLQYGPWALVTGASSGIGQEFTRQLASMGINVAVAARRQSRLESLVSDIKTEHGVQARAIPVDLTDPDCLEVIESAVIPGRLNRLMTFTMTHLMPRNMALSMLGNMMAKTMDPAML